MSVWGTGSTTAKIMLVGECFSADEESCGEAFQGTPGLQLNKMLFEAGIHRGDCYTTNLLNLRPPYDNIKSLFAFTKKMVKPGYSVARNLYCAPEIHQGLSRLFEEIALLKPTVIIALGDKAMWALSGAMGILKWRGSRIPCIDLNGKDIGIPVIPTLAPLDVVITPKHRAMVVSDLRRAKTLLSEKHLKPIGADWQFTLRPTADKVLSILGSLIKRLDQGIPLWVDFDLETRAGHIACAGISWTKTDALCIPLMCVEIFEGYWNLDEEASIIFTLYRLLTHKYVRVRGQNLLYDCQYTYRHWHFVPRVIQDTMISHHTCFVGLPNSRFIAKSIYIGKMTGKLGQKVSVKINCGLITQSIAFVLGNVGRCY